MTPAPDRRLIIVMGVAGSGKSTVGRALAQRLSLPFIEGDSLHPAENVAKMSAGIPLVDADRLPWLDKIALTLNTAVGGAVASCSALKRAYRDRLRAGVGRPVGFLYLFADPELLAHRMTARQGHFMSARMLQSQLETLEPPQDEPDVFCQDAELSLRAIVNSAAVWTDSRFD